LASLAELMVRVGADISEFTRNMQQVDRTMQDTGKGLMNVGKSMTSAGQKMATSVTAPLLAMGTAAVVTGANFDAQMSKVSAVSGATGKDFDKLREQAKTLGSTTVWSASEAASGMEFLARAGFKTNDILETMPSLLDLASASATDLGTTADITSNIMSGFGISAQESGRIADVLAKTTASANTDMLQLGDAMKYSAPISNLLGISMEETAAAIGFMSDAGIQGSMAGTSLAGGLSRLMNPVGEAKKAMEELGLSAYDSNGKFKSLETIMGELEAKTKGMSEEQKNQTLAMLFGQEAGKGWFAMLERGSGELGEFTGELENSDGTASNMAKTMNDNLAGSFKNLLSALEGLAISFSDVMTPAVKKATEFITGLVSKFDSLSPKTKGIIVVVGLLVAAIAPLLIVIGLVAQGVGAMVTVFGLISAPVLIVIGVIALLGAAFIALWKNSETFRNGVITVFNAVKTAIMTAIGIVVTFLKEKLAQIKAFWNENGTQILQAVQNVWNGILKVIEFVMPLVLAVVKMVWNSIKGIIDGVLNFIMGLIKVFAGLFTGDFKKMWEGIKQMFFGAVQAIWNYLNLMFIGRIIKGIGAFIKGAISMFKSFGSSFIGFFKGMWDKGWQLVDDFCEAVVTLFKMFIQRGKSNFQAFKGVIMSIWTSIKTGVVNLVTGLKNGAINVFNGLKSTVSTIFNGIKNLITKPIETAKNTVLKIIDAIKGAFNKMKIKIPKPKLPKVSVAMKKGVMGIPYPDFDISWNAKGGIWNSATVLGGGQGVAEKGAEAVLPIQHKRYMKPFASAVAAHMDTLGGGSNNEPQVIENHVHTTIELDGEVVGRKVEKYVSRSQLDRQKRTNRGGGRR
jgi:TP901 family phage tail tape measure protein